MAHRISQPGRVRVAVVRFPGSNCDQDLIDVLDRHFGLKAMTAWHTDTELPLCDAVLIPGGFSFGDYLRSGALAAHSPVMMAVGKFARQGGAVLGICNGFQILTEAGILPGALLRNISRRFICQTVNLTVGEGTSAYHKALRGKVLRIPIAHGEGRYFISAEGLRALEAEGQIVFRYGTQPVASGQIVANQISNAENPNGSIANIAGICSTNGRVCGLMPHPERASDTLLGGLSDGLGILEAFLASVL